MTYLGSWMINSHQVEREQSFEHVACTSIPMESFGVTGLVEKAPDDGKYYPTRELEELAAERMAAYDKRDILGRTY